MAFSIGVSGVWKNTSAAWIGVSGVWKLVLNMWVGSGGAWKQFFSALGVTANNVSKHSISLPFCTGSQSTGNPGAVVSGGSGSYTYSWARTSGCHSYGCMTCSNTAILNPIWSGGACDDSAITSETWRLTVTDSVTGATAQVSISVTRTHISTA